MTISKLLIEGVETAGPNATVEALALRLVDAGVGSIIIEEEMKPVGIITLDDLIQLLVTELSNLVDVIEAESTAY